MDELTKQERKIQRIKRSLKSQITDEPEDRFNWDVSVHDGFSPTIVMVHGPRHLEDDELRAGLSGHGYETGDYMHVTSRGPTKQTNIYLFG